MLVGGSNVAFGYDCASIDAELPVNPVNMGLNAGYGLDFILEEALDGLRAGDVAVVSPEYGHFVELRAEVPLFELLEVRPSAVRYLNAEYLPHLLDQSHEYLGRQLQRTYLLMTGARADREMPYRRDAVDRYGDIVGHEHLPRPGPHDLDTPLRLSARSIARATASLRSFDARARERGATVLYEFPPIPDVVFERWHDEIVRVEAAVAELGMPVLHAPYGWPVDRFFDTKYHLTRAGARERTATLIRALGPHLGYHPRSP